MPASSFETSFPPLTVDHVLDLGVLTIRTQQDNDADVLALDGELDVASCGEVEAQLRGIEGQCSDPATIVIDLRGVTFIDSSGLRLLIEATNRAQTASHRLRLLRPNHRVFRVCEIAGIDTLLPFENAGAEDDG